MKLRCERDRSDRAETEAVREGKGVIEREGGRGGGGGEWRVHIPMLRGRLRLCGEGVENSMNLVMGRRAVLNPATLALCSVRFWGSWTYELVIKSDPHSHSDNDSTGFTLMMLRSTIPPMT